MIQQTSEESFQREKRRLTIRILVISGIAIISAESLLMLILDYYFDIERPIVMLLDVLFLVLILFPFIYYFIVRPMFKQVEDHYHTNLELLKSYEIVERFFSINDVMIAYLDADFNFIRVNQAYADADQRQAGEFVGKNHFALFPNPENQALFESVVRTGKPISIIEKPFVYAEHPERGVSYWDWSLIPIKTGKGRVIALFFVLTDVTERKMARLARDESERRFHAVFNQTLQHTCLMDPSGNILDVNQTALDFTGIPSEQLAGKPLSQAPWWASSPEEMERLATCIQAAAGGRTMRCEARLHSSGGDLAIMDINIKPLLDEQNHPFMLLYEAHDITRRTRAEEALKRSEAEIMRLYHAEIRAHHFAEILRSAGLALSGSLNMDTVLETLLDHLHNVTPYAYAHISMVDDNDHLAVRYARGEETWNEADRMLGKRFEINQIPLVQTLMQGRQTTCIADIRQHPEEFPGTNAYRSWLGMPLMAGDHVIGICALKHPDAGFFTEEMVTWASALMGQAAVAIQNAWLFEQVRDGRERMQALSRRLVEVQESERHYIARELHDEAGQALASLMVGLRVIERDSKDPAAVEAGCQELKTVADGVLADLHRLAIDLRPASLDRLGLVAALRQHTEMVSDQHALAVEFETVGKIERLPGEVETAIYRIVQEALTNVVRHAQATRVDILLERVETGLLVVIEDDGIGFDPQQPTTDHLGVLGMRERADMLGGALTIESAPGKGSSILLEVPCLFES